MGTRSLALAALLFAAAAFPAAARAEAKMNFVGDKSMYAKVGLRTGDVVLSIDGKAPKSGIEVGQLIHERFGDGKKHKILIRRGPEMLTLEFGP